MHQGSKTGAQEERGVIKRSPVPDQTRGSTDTAYSFYSDIKPISPCSPGADCVWFNALIPGIKTETGFRSIMFGVIASRLRCPASLSESNLTQEQRFFLEIPEIDQDLHAA